MGSVPLMLVFTAIAAFGTGPWQGDMNAVIACCSEYTYLTKGKRIDGAMYSCTLIVIAFIMSKMNVEKTNAELQAAKFI